MKINRSLVEDDVLAIVYEFAIDAGHEGAVELKDQMRNLNFDWLDRDQLLTRLENHFEVTLEDEPLDGEAATVSDWVSLVYGALLQKQLMEGAEV